MNIFKNSKDNSKKGRDGIPIRFGEKTIVFMPGVQWNKFYQRPQGLITALAQMMPDWNFIFCDNSASMPLKRQADNLYLVSNDWYKQKFDELCEGIFYTTIPRIHKEFSKARGKWFDFVDDPDVFYPKFDRATTRPQKDTEKMLECADVITCSSQRLIDDYVENDKDKTMLLKNACWSKNTNLQPFKKKVPIVIGFWGFLGDWVDVDLLSYLSDHFPVIVAGNPINVGSIRNMGILHHSQLKSMASICSHLIIPFKEGNISYYSDPLKYYEYLYTNRMIILPENMETKTDDKRELEYSYDNDWEKLVEDIETVEFWNLDQLPHDLHSWETRAFIFMKRYILS